MTAWYEEAFRAGYLDVYAHRDAAEATREVAAWIGKVPGLLPGARVLDLACGAGRHVHAMRDRGIAAVGLDLSAELLAEAAGDGTLRVVRGDMRRLPFRSGAFRAVTCFFTSFGYFEDEADDALALREASRVLAPGGGFLLDLMDAESTRRDLRAISRARRGDALLIEEERSLVQEGRRVQKKVRLSGSGRADRHWVESVRLYSPEELEAMAAAAGLRAAGRYGGHEAGPWVCGVTPRCVLLFTREAG